MATRCTLATLLLAACGSGGHGKQTGDDSVDAPASPDATVYADAAFVDPGVTVFTIVFENHDYAEIVGSSNATYINTLIAKGALATNYKDTNHPSLPNYLHLISGADQYPGVVDLDPTQTPYFPAAQPNLGTQLEAAHIKWRSYQESMGTPCSLTDSGNYAPRHDPFLYFVDQQTGADGLCAATNVDYSSFAADLASNTYRYMWITPNLLDDGHNPQDAPVTGLKQSDTWLSTELPKILASDAYNDHGGVVFITWDEAEGRNGDDADKIPMIVLSKNIKQAGMTSATLYNHSSTLATVEDLLGLPRLATVSTTANMMEFLNH